MSLQKSSSNFTTTTIVSQNTDGWQSNWASSYLNILSGTPNHLRVSGTAPAIARTFSNVQANNQHTLTYTQTQNNIVKLVVEQSGNGTTWSTLLSTTTSNGTHTQTFTASASHVRVRYSASDSFQVSEVVLNGVEEIMVVNVIQGGFAKYRYQFNGMEVDNEIKGMGNSYTTEFRQYDPRLGRWLSIDPLFQNFPWQSPYVAFDYNPIYYNDPLGAASEVTATNLTVDDKGKDPLFRGGKFGEDELVIKPSAEHRLNSILTKKTKTIKEIFKKVTNFITKTISDALRKADGWIQTDGLYLVRNSRIGSPTKTRSNHPGREINIDGLVPALGGLKSSDIKTLIDRIKSITDGLTKIEEATENHNGPDPRIKDGYYDPSKVPQSNKIHWRMKKSRYGSNTGQRFDASPKEMINGDTLGGNSDINLYPGNKGHIKD